LVKEMGHVVKKKRKEGSWASGERDRREEVGRWPTAAKTGQKKKKRRGGGAGPKERRMAGWAKRREEGKRDMEGRLR
jgi:hypothetical protein